MSFDPRRLCLLVVVSLTLALVACEDDDSEPVTTPTAPPAGTSEPTVTSPPAATETPPASTVDPCTLRDALDGRSLVPGPAFVLEEATAWQLCIGGAAAGSSEKYLFGTEDGGATWTLLAMTTLGDPPPEEGVGELPNGNAAEALFFIDEERGWLGLSSPGQNLYRSDDGGVRWTAVEALPSGLPVTEIEFSDAENGTLTTPEGDYVTADGGATWTPAP